MPKKDDNLNIIEDRLQNPEFPKVDYTDDELAYRSYLMIRLNRAADERNANHPEFDDQDYITYDETNAKAANSYIPPKRNKQDTRVVTGTTKEKEITLLSALLNFNLEPNVEAFDEKDLVINELGDNMEDLIKKSRIIEEYEDKRVLIYKELLDQGTVFVEEQWVEEYKIDKKIKGKIDVNNITKTEWTEDFKKDKSYCNANLLMGTNVYLGNVKEFFIQKQPFLFTYDVVPYDEAKSVYGKWERWENVPRKIKRTKPDEASTSYDDWTLLEIQDEMVEIIKYQDKINNEYMIMLNGVMMLPEKFPLTAISESGSFTIAKGDIEPINAKFAYSKSIPAKTKVDQAVLDEMLRLIILKTQQSFMPPYANNSNRLLSKRIFMPGKITQNLDANLLQPIGDANGVNPAEFSAFELIKSIVNEKSVSPQFSGDQSKGDQTATEILELKKQQMMKLGLTIYGVVALERHLSWLRIVNGILPNWTKATDEEVDDIKGDIRKTFRTVSVEADLEDGQKGMKITEFNPELANTLKPEQIEAEEEFLSEPGKPVRKIYLNPDELRKTRATWYITITPTEKDSNELDRVLNSQGLMDAINIFGIQSINMPYQKQRWAILNKEDPEKYFNQGQQAMPQEMQGQQPIESVSGGKIGGQLTAGVKQPGLNQMAQQ